MNAKLSIDLIEQGISTFGSEEAFLSWLQKENFFFDKKAPNEFLDNDKGMKFIKDRLEGMSYGDNM
jgi:uncharacterized protein (DUF2384 family)